MDSFTSHCVLQFVADRRMERRGVTRRRSMLGFAFAKRERDTPRTNGLIKPTESIAYSCRSTVAMTLYCKL